jgi:hypothetical protein
MGQADGCCVCGRWATWYAVVPDSSHVDGRRAVAACSSAHLAVVRQVYAARPWVVEELWYARIRRARAGAVEPMTAAQLAAAAGLSLTQGELAYGFNRARMRRRLLQMGIVVHQRRARRRLAVNLARCASAG